MPTVDEVMRVTHSQDLFPQEWMAENNIFNILMLPEESEWGNKILRFNTLMMSTNDLGMHVRFVCDIDLTMLLLAENVTEMIRQLMKCRAEEAVLYDAE